MLVKRKQRQLELDRLLRNGCICQHAVHARALNVSRSREKSGMDPRNERRRDMLDKRTSVSKARTTTSDLDLNPPIAIADDNNPRGKSKVTFIRYIPLSATGKIIREACCGRMRRRARYACARTGCVKTPDFPAFCHDFTLAQLGLSHVSQVSYHIAVRNTSRK